MCGQNEISTGTFTSSADRGNVIAEAKRALIIEDVREAADYLRDCNYICDRITHAELMSSGGESYLGKLINGDYKLLWIATPIDWAIRLPDKRSTAHFQRIQNWMKKACNLQVAFVLMGPPGYLWKIPNVAESIKELGLSTTRMRLCYFGEKYDKLSDAPSGSYIQVAANFQIPTKWRCSCQCSMEKHALDWYGSVAFS